MAMKIQTRLPEPEDLKQEYPMTREMKEKKTVRDGEIQNVFTGYSDKFLVIVGPCSADNEDSVCEYVERLARLNEEVKDKLILIPRIYTNKPRTTGEGYKGMLHQPRPDQAPNLLEGLIAIRKLHLHAIAVSGLTGADEMLYPENRSYLDAPSDSKRYGYPGGNEKSDQRRSFGDAEFDQGSSGGSSVHLPDAGRYDKRKSAGTRHPPGRRGQIRNLYSKLPL